MSAQSQRCLHCFRDCLKKRDEVAARDSDAPFEVVTKRTVVPSVKRGACKVFGFGAITNLKEIGRKSFEWTLEFPRDAIFREKRNRENGWGKF